MKNTGLGRSLWNKWYTNLKIIPIAGLDSPWPSDQGEEMFCLADGAMARNSRLIMVF